jgi:spore germination protein GerM
VAVRKPYNKGNGKKQSGKPSSRAIVIFWLIFFSVIILVFMLNIETIKKNFEMFKTYITNSPAKEADLQEEYEVSVETNLEQPRTDNTSIENTPVSNQIVVITDSPAHTSNTSTASERAESQTHTENTVPPETQSRPPAVQTQAPIQTRERTIYFTQIDRDGQILQSKVTRMLPVTDAPMTDVLTAMLAGLSTDEISHGILNFIPKNTRLLNAVVRGSTAYLSFSEDFLFNTFGIEGYLAQLRQIVWTVTEFSTVYYVQILIELRRIDYLGEGIYIGSPVNRRSF